MSATDVAIQKKIFRSWLTLVLKTVLNISNEEMEDIMISS